MIFADYEWRLNACNMRDDDNLFVVRWTILIKKNVFICECAETLFANVFFPSLIFLFLVFKKLFIVYSFFCVRGAESCPPII